MAYDSPAVANPSVYGKPPEDCEEECEKLCEGRTIDELNQIADYFREKASKMRQFAESELTMEDFEEAKKDKEENYDDKEVEE